ncbi:hypothetical protein OURE66S_04549 [Oligella ureolytica]
MNVKTKLIERVRHPIKMRLLTVKRITELSPSMRRITLTGPDLPEFLSASFSNHLKLILPAVQGEKPNMPVVGENGMEFDESRPKPVMRDYTPRRYDPETNELDVDFVLEHAGPATDCRAIQKLVIMSVLAVHVALLSYRPILTGTYSWPMRQHYRHSAVGWKNFLAQHVPLPLSSCATRTIKLS